MNTNPDIEGRTLEQDLMNEDGTRLLTEGRVVNSRYMRRVAALPEQPVKVKPFVSMNPDSIEYLAADGEEGAGHRDGERGSGREGAVRG